MLVTRLLALSLMIMLGLFKVDAQAVQLKSDTASLALRPYVEVLEDPTGKLTLSKVERAENASRFHAFPGTSDLNFGYTSSAIWLRLRLIPEINTPAFWLLEIAYPSLDHVEMYTRHENNLIHMTSGDHRPFTERPYAHRNLIFPLTLAPESEQVIFLRVESSGSLTLPLTLWTPSALHSHDQRIYSLFAFYFGMLLALGLYNLLLYFSLRESIYLTYFAFVAWLTIGQLSMIGLGNQFFWPDSPVWGNFILPTGYCLTGYFGTSFTRLFLNTKRNSPRFDRFFQSLQIGFLIGAIAPVFGFYSIGGIIVAILGATFSVTSVICGVIAVKDNQPGARLFLVAWSLFLFGVALLGFRTLDWLPTNLLTSYGMQIGSALEMLLLSFALADRIHALRKDKELAQAEALHSKGLAMEALQRSEKELEQLIEERTSELAEANERLLKSEETQRQLANHDPLTGLANRIYLQHKLELVIARAKRESSTFAMLVVDLDGFKPVNDDYGHSVGDKVLIGVARRFLECVRVTDIVARVGGDEFVLIIEDLRTLEYAQQVSEKIIALLNTPFEIDGQSIKVGASSGIALWPSDSRDIEKLFHLADQAMYQAKQSGQGRYQVAVNLHT